MKKQESQLVYPIILYSSRAKVGTLGTFFLVLAFLGLYFTVNLENLTGLEKFKYLSATVIFFGLSVPFFWRFFRGKLVLAFYKKGFKYGEADPPLIPWTDVLAVEMKEINYRSRWGTEFSKEFLFIRIKDNEIAFGPPKKIGKKTFLEPNPAGEKKIGIKTGAFDEEFYDLKGLFDITLEDYRKGLLG